MRRRRQSGFTIIEIMITIAVVAVLAAVGVPAIGNLIKNNRVRAHMFEVLDSIQLTRSEATKRRQAVVMCRTADPTAGTPVCGGTANTWTTGWLIFEDKNGNSSYDSGTDVLIKAVNPAAEGNITVMTNSVCNNNLSYKSDGSLNESGTAKFAICDDRGVGFGRQVNVALVGRASVIAGTPGSPLTSCTAP